MLEQWKAGRTRSWKLEALESWNDRKAGKVKYTWKNWHDQNVSCTKIRGGTLSVLDKYLLVYRNDSER
jgi:hypothetical protein